MKPPSKKKSRKPKETEQNNKLALVANDKTVKTRKKSKSRENKEIALTKSGILKKDKENTFINPKATEKDALMQEAGEVELTVKVENKRKRRLIIM